MPDESRVKPQPLQPEAWTYENFKANFKRMACSCETIECSGVTTTDVEKLIATIEEARSEQPVRVTDEPGYTRDQAIAREVREMLTWALKMPPPQRYEELIGLAESKMARMFEQAEAFAVDVNRDLDRREQLAAAPKEGEE